MRRLIATTILAIAVAAWATSYAGSASVRMGARRITVSDGAALYEYHYISHRSSGSLTFAVSPAPVTADDVTQSLYGPFDLRSAGCAFGRFENLPGTPPSSSSRSGS